ncbi:MAG: bifunctional adenosylcobinamide kinase/adenosylcobinamide-phosphate guanylyltransferase [bacterium]|nr:bifunctional adenosylcobinamide kinase/adenosylcobinamide-phosphate guanylyltransferase [bacterium]
MILVIGGMGQGKLAAVLRNTEYTEKDVTCTPGEGKPVLNDLQEAVRSALAEGKTQEQILAELAGHAVIISDEVGCGVVPVDRFEREWRETVGRICCLFAKNAKQVVRVFCGVPMVLKGETQWK